MPRYLQKVRFYPVVPLFYLFILFILFLCSVVPFGPLLVRSFVPSVLLFRCSFVLFRCPVRSFGPLFRCSSVPFVPLFLCSLPCLDVCVRTVGLIGVILARRPLLCEIFFWWHGLSARCGQRGCGASGRFPGAQPLAVFVFQWNVLCRNTAVVVFVSELYVYIYHRVEHLAQPLLTGGVVLSPLLLSPGGLDGSEI